MVHGQWEWEARGNLGTLVSSHLGQGCPVVKLYYFSVPYSEVPETPYSAGAESSRGSGHGASGVGKPGTSLPDCLI
jgi:hypothetical protein